MRGQHRANNDIKLYVHSDHNTARGVSATEYGAWAWLI